MKNDIKWNNTLPQLPDGFDKKNIVMPDKGRRGFTNTIRLSNGDFDPIARAKFKGYFAVANNKCIGSKESVAERAKRILEQGGDVYLVRNVRSDKEGYRKVSVRLVETFSYLNGRYVVLHVEP